jgi:hypothetical protein
VIDHEQQHPHWRNCTEVFPLPPENQGKVVFSEGLLFPGTYRWAKTNKMK